MKLSRTLAIGAATLVVAGSTLMVGGTASAADYYVNSGSFIAEVSPYPSQWFIGGGSTGTATTVASGLNLNGTSGRIQVLNGTPSSTTDLGALVGGADFVLVSGNANFQIPLFTNGATDTGFTTLRPDNFGPVGLNPLAGWTTSGAFGTFLPNSSHTIPEYVAELAAQALTPEILGFGLISPAGQNAVVSSVTWDGNTHWFLPRPTATISAATITLSQFATAGVTATLSGFIPGETVDTGYGTGSSGSSMGTTVADANGVATVTFTTATTATAAGTTYSLMAFGLTSGAESSASFALTADPAAVAVTPAAALPPTGADATPIVIGASILLFAGAAALGTTALRRRSLAKN